MVWTELLPIVQAVPDLAPALERIAGAQTLTAGAIVLVSLMALAAAVMAFAAVRSVRRTLRSLEQTLGQLAPRTGPILDHATSAAQDVSEMTRKLRCEIDDFTVTLKKVNQQLRGAVEESTDRIRQFGAVLDVVQQEAQELLMDAAATAHGVHAAADALYAPREDRLPPPKPSGEPTAQAPPAHPHDEDPSHDAPPRSSEAVPG